MNAKGYFIAIDGTDGSGKTVQTNRLYERLKQEGYRAETVDFPSYGKPSAYFVERYLAGEYGSAEAVGPYRASMFYALDRYDHAKRLRGLLEEGVILVSNRYTSGNKGHQMGKLKDGAERRAFLAWLNDLEYGMLGIPKPDLTLLLHVPAEIGQQLSSSRDQNKKDIHQESLEHLKAAEAAYLQLPAMDEVEHWEVVECAPEGSLLPIDDIHERIWNMVKPMLPSLR